MVFTPLNASHGLSDNQIRYILQLPDERMVFATRGNVNLFDGAQFTYLHSSPGDAYALSKYSGHTRIYQGDDSLLWIKTWGTLTCVDLQTQSYIPNPDKVFSESGVDEPVENLFVDSGRRLWLLTPGGLTMAEGGRTIDISADEGELQDVDTRDGLLYLFYNTGEVVCYDPGTGERLYAKAAYPEDERRNFHATSLVVKGDDGFYQLRNGRKGGLFFFDPAAREWKKILERRYTLNTLLVAPGGEVYITSPVGIMVYDPGDGTLDSMEVLETTEGEVVSTEISTIFMDKQGGLWVGTLNRGLLYYHPSRYRFIHVGRTSFTDSASSDDINVETFAEDAAGNIYVRTRSKYYRYVPVSGGNRVLEPVTPGAMPDEVTNVLRRSRPAAVYRGETYTALCTDVRGWTWAGTPDGLRLFKSDGGEQRVFYTDDGLSNNFVHNILEDRNRNIWVTTSSGISRICVDEKGEIHFTNFNTHDGVLKGEYMAGAAFEASDGTLYFGGVDGFNVLADPVDLAVPHFPSRPVFTALNVLGKEIRAGTEYDGRLILPRTPPYTDGIELSHHQNFLVFEFSALNYRNPAQARFRYRLDGMDDEWHELSVGSANRFSRSDGILRIPYTDLRPGNYTLHVMSSDDGATWDGDARRLTVTVHAPWWATTFALVLFSLLALSVVAGVVWFYISAARKKQERHHQEGILLLRIRNLVEQCNQYEAALRHATQTTEPSAVCDCKEDACGSPECEKHNVADTAFIARAIKYVEQNMDNDAYSVVQLSRDLCMDRTGLYRKLISLLDESPSIFIRNIRLNRAAQLLMEGELSVTEISYRVGFNSLSYMSKRFVEIHGCRPSEYREKMRQG